MTIARRPIASIAQVDGLQGALNSRTPPAHGGRVIFRFDGGFKAVRTIAMPEMAKRGFVGTVGVITANIGSGDYMSAQDLCDLVEAGWDVGSHTKTNLVSTSVTPELFGADMDASIADLLAAGVPYPRTFTYVAGTRNADTDKQVYYRFDRCFTTVTPLGAPDPSRPTFMLPGGVGVNGTSGTNAQDLEVQKRYVERRLAMGQTAIVQYHNIAETPASEITASTADFVALLDFIAARNYPVGLPAGFPPHNLIEDPLFARYDIAATANYSSAYTLLGPWHFGRDASKMLRVADATPPFGTYAISLDSARNGVPAFDYVQQWIPVIPGKVYRWRYWENVTAITANDVRGGLVAYNCIAGAVATRSLAITNAPTDGWVQRTGTWTAPANTEYVLFRWQSSTMTGTAFFAAPAFYLSDAFDHLA